MEDTSAPVKPRLATSLILFRGEGEVPEVLIGMRNQNLRFMPGYLVFPGGAVEEQDYARQPSTHMHSGTEKALTRHVSSQDALATVCTAIRETEEETGLNLRALEDLDVVGRAITPESSPIRFDAYFFLADGASLEGSPASTGELEAVAWRPADFAMASDAIADVTRFMLARALAIWTAGVRHVPKNRPLPVFTYHGETPTVIHEDGTCDYL